MHMVSEETAQTYSHPDTKEIKNDGEQYKIDKAQWQKGIAHVITGITSKDTAHGTLVLCCSYDDINAISQALGIESNRLLLKTPIISLEKQKEEFKERSRRGERPVWFATGNAWTGLDLRDDLVSDDQPHADKILTDLILPRINFSDNQTLSGLMRARRNGANFTEAAFSLRQGIGRLIRRPGLSNRRVWILDGRIWLKGVKYNVFRKILAGYSKRGEVSGVAKG